MAIKQIDPPKRTTVAQFSTFKEAFVPGWDSNANSQQKMDRVAQRESMGQKKTPIGRGTLKRG